MEENEQEQMNAEENDLQQNYQNNYSVPQNPPPQYYQPQMAPVYQPPINPPVEQMILSPINSSGKKDISSSNVAKGQQRPTDYAPWEMISFLSWFFFISSKWDLYMKVNFWDKLDLEHGSLENYRPILYNARFIQLITLIISIIGFLVYVKNIIYKRNNDFYNGLFGQITKFHSVPLLFYSTINIILSSLVILYRGQIEPRVVSFIKENTKFDLNALMAFYMIFSLLSLLSLIFIYYSTDLHCEWYIVMAIIYSILIVESLYFFFDSIFFLRFVNISGSPSNLESLYNTGGVMFAIFQGVVIIVLSLYFKDITMPIFNFLIFYGMIFNFYNKWTFKKTTNGVEEVDDYKKTSTVVVEIIMVVLHFLLIVFMISKYKEQLIQS